MSTKIEYNCSSNSNWGQRGCYKIYKKALDKKRRHRPEVRAKEKARKQTPEAKAKRKEYNQRPEVKEVKENYRQRPESKARKKELRDLPENKAKRIIYRNREENRARTKELRDRPEAKAKRKEYMKEWGSKPENIRNGRSNYLLRKYGITIEDKEKRFKDQNGSCKTCKKPFEVLWGTKEFPSDCHVDHDHVSGRIRALLCVRCNTILGTPNRILKELIRYKEEHQILDLMNGNDYDQEEKET